MWLQVEVRQGLLPSTTKQALGTGTASKPGGSSREASTGMARRGKFGRDLCSWRERKRDEKNYGSHFSVSEGRFGKVILTRFFFVGSLPVVDVSIRITCIRGTGG